MVNRNPAEKPAKTDFINNLLCFAFLETDFFHNITQILYRKTKSVTRKEGNSTETLQTTLFKMFLRKIFIFSLTTQYSNG